MNFLTAIIDGLVEFVRRNPLTCLIVVVMALVAPAVLKGIAVFFLYLILGIVVLVFVVTLLFRWRIYKVRKQMEEQFGPEGFGTPFGAERQPAQEGEVKVYKTSETPEKKVSGNVGDYVEFEETKTEKEQ